MIMFLLYSSFGDYENAMRHANEFPWRVDTTNHSMYAFINHAFKEYNCEQINLQRDLQQQRYSTINTQTLLGVAYENIKSYEETLKMYFLIFEIINYLFKEDDYVPAFYRV